MGILTIDKDELLAQSTDDGNTLTEIDGVVMQKKLRQDVFNEVFDTVQWTKGLLYPAGESGTVTESGGKVNVTTISTITPARFMGFYTPLDYDPNTEFSLSYDWDSYQPNNNSGNNAGMEIAVDADNRIIIRRIGIIGAGVSQAAVIVGGVVKLNATLPNTVTSGTFRMRRVGTVVFFDHNIGAGFVNVGSYDGVLFNNASIYPNVRAGEYKNCSMNYNNLVITAPDTWPRWVSKGDTSDIVTTYNQQDVGAGTTIRYGSASFNQGSNMTYRVKAGTSAWSAWLNAAGIQALGDVVTDNGNFDMEAKYGGSTAQASWTLVNIPTVGVGGTPIFRSGIFQSKILRGVV